MNALIGGSLAGSKRITGSIKLTICMAAIIGLTSTGSVSAVPTTTFTLNADSLTPGIYGWDGIPRLTVLSIAEGDVTFAGQILPVHPTKADIDLVNAGSGTTGNTFDIIGPADYAGPPAGDQTAQLFFDFEVISVTFIYGGNDGDLRIEARDLSNTQIAFHYEPTTIDSKPAGPKTLSGAGIRSLWWYDSMAGQGYGSLDNIEIIVPRIPAPGALMLAGIGVGCVSGLRKRKIA
jgi:hypothetical protein